MKWIEQAGIALMLALLLHSVWRQQHLGTQLQRQVEEPPPPPPAQPTQPMQVLGFSVAPWEP